MISHSMVVLCIGFGLILSRGVVQNLVRPVFCNGTNKDDFERNVCSRLDDNLVGEAQYFTDGMSVSDLMGAHVRNNLFTSYQNNPTWAYCKCPDFENENHRFLMTLSHSSFARLAWRLGHWLLHQHVLFVSSCQEPKFSRYSSRSH